MDSFQDKMASERRRQIDIWGERNLDLSYYFTILSEETGEVARAILEEKKNQIKIELVQVATVAMAMHDSIENGTFAFYKLPNPRRSNP